MASLEGAKNRITHDVNKLFQLFGIRQTNCSETYTFGEQLEKSIAPYIATQITSHNSKLKLCDNNPQAEEFQRKYEELKLKNFKELDSFVFLLSKIKEDKHVSGALESLGYSGGGGTDESSKENRRIGDGPIVFDQTNLNELQKLIATTSNVAKNISTDTLRNALPESQRGRPIDLPMQPDWLFDRPYLSADFNLHEGRTEFPSVPIGTLPPAVQEQAIVEDILFTLQGIEGTYVKPLPLEQRCGRRTFDMDSTLHPSLLEVTRQLLPVCANYSTIVRFVEEKSAFEYGLVNQALASAIRRLMKDYSVLICQLEEQHNLGQLRLSRLHFFLQETGRLFEVLSGLATDINTGECIGGAVLSLLHNHTRTAIGEVKVHELLLYLIRAASVPFFEMLQKWIYRGVIADPYKEFFIDESRGERQQKSCLTQEFAKSAFYWEEHYRVVPTRVPGFLESYVTKILNTGKYLNVAQQCGSEWELPRAEEIVYSTTDRQYVEQIERAYLYSSRLLLDLMIKQKELKERLKSVKHYLLLDQGDFIVHFMDTAEPELRKSAKDVSLSRLESLLELALRTSTANVDQHKDNLKVVLFDFDLITQMFRVLCIQSDAKLEPLADINLTGLEAFSLDYKVTWPLSLVLNRQAMDHYQMLFRHLFYCRHVERLLCNVWTANKIARTFSLQRTPWFSTAFALRQRMLNFIQHFQYYMTVEVIEPNWLQFMQQIDQASNLDEILTAHMQFLTACLANCLLTTPELLRIVHKLLVVCVTFSNFIQRVSSSSTKAAQAQTDPDMGGRRRRQSQDKILLQDPQGIVIQPGPSSSTSRRGSRAKEGAGSPALGVLMTADALRKKVVMEDMDLLLASDSFERTVESFDVNFIQLLVELLNKIRDHSSSAKLKISNLNSRLDFNGYYSEYGKTSGGSADVPWSGRVLSASSAAPPSGPGQEPAAGAGTTYI